MTVLFVISVCLSLTFLVESAPVVKITYPPCGNELVTTLRDISKYYRTPITKKSYTARPSPTVMYERDSSENDDDITTTVRPSTPCEDIVERSTTPQTTELTTRPTTELTTKPNTEKTIKTIAQKTSLRGVWVILAVLVGACILIYAAYLVYIKLHSGSYITHERYISSSMVSLLSTSDIICQ